MLQEKWFSHQCVTVCMLVFTDAEVTPSAAWSLPDSVLDCRVLIKLGLIDSQHSQKRKIYLLMAWIELMRGSVFESKEKVRNYSVRRNNWIVCKPDSRLSARPLVRSAGRFLQVGKQTCRLGWRCRVSHTAFHNLGLSLCEWGSLRVFWFLVLSSLITCLENIINKITHCHINLLY